MLSVHFSHIKVFLEKQTSILASALPLVVYLCNPTKNFEGIDKNNLKNKESSSIDTFQTFHLKLKPRSLFQDLFLIKHVAVLDSFIISILLLLQFHAVQTPDLSEHSLLDYILCKCNYGL